MATVKQQRASLEAQLEQLTPLLEFLLSAPSPEERLAILDAHPAVNPFIASSPHLESFFVGLEIPSQIALKAVIAIGQGPRLLRIPDNLEDKADRLRVLLGQLLEVEQFYNTIGGIVGYHTAVIRLLLHREKKEGPAFYHHPPGADYTHPSPQQNGAILAGIEGLSSLAEIYPVGGAGDRLGLIDPDTGNALPAALLDFCGRTLLEGMVRDLSAREYLHFRLTGNRITTPIALMTSEEKNNHLYISTLCEELGWFGRPKESLLFFSQPLAPQITEEGNWVVEAPLEMGLKPGGHGALWKLMEDKGVFDWLAQQGRNKALVRQINNPIAGTDSTLLAFTGAGLQEDRAFGFAACSRKVGSAEGCDVLIERKTEEGWNYTLTNIEYTELAKHGIEDTPVEANSPYSKFPSNTNILFADLNTVREATRTLPIPGMLINMKKQAITLDESGEPSAHYAGRLESTMQNIADRITYTSPTRLTPRDELGLPTYLVFLPREKTISVAKRSHQPGEDPHETPVGAYYDHLANCRELFADYCAVRMPALPESAPEQPPFHLLYHPALGPTFSLIAQKIQGGKLTVGSELVLEIAELSWSNVTVDGSLQIRASSPTGEGSSLGGKCLLRDCTFTNKGIDTGGDNTYWRHQIKRRESFQIEIEGDGEFVAEGVTFSGSQRIVVHSGTRITARMKGGKLVLEEGEPGFPRGLWAYQVGANRALVLRPQERSSS
ncbi:MAG: UTP--glucose-1-phosphate uridylyltransferase [Parachlamydiales bacterium]